MLLKRFNEKGDKYYINAFTGNQVDIPYVSPVKIYVKKEKTDEITHGDPKGFFVSNKESKTKKTNDKRSADVGNFKRFMRIEPKSRDRNEFIKVCKRLNINPYELMDLAIRNPKLKNII